MTKRFWVACGDYRQPIAKNQIQQARDFFGGCYDKAEVLILKDGDPRLKDYKDFTTMDLE
jgi:hypothetical protein